MGDAAGELCTRLSTGIRPAKSVLGVAVAQSPTDRRRHWSSHCSLDDVAVEFVDVDSQTRAASPVEQGRAHEHRVTTVADPTDLATLRRRIGERLAALDGRTSLCFHSLTDVLVFAECERTLEFLHALADDVTAADAYAHYHLDAGAHDDETIDMFGTVTDRVIERNRDGSDAVVR